jgi:hypothetical protein
VAATVLTAARGDYSPPILHPGWQLLSPTYWQELLSDFSVCAQHMQLMCPRRIVGWFEIVALAGSAVLVFTASGARRRYGAVIIFLLAVLHFTALLSVRHVLGRLHVVSTPFLMWAFFPLAMPAAIAFACCIAGW